MINTLDIKITSGNKTIRSILEQYWETRSGGYFVGKVADIAKSNGLSSHELSTLVREGSDVRRNDIECESCGKNPSVFSRTDAHKPSYQIVDDLPWTCKACKESTKKEYIANAKQEAQMEGVTHADLSCTDLINVLALLEYFSDEKLSYLIPAESVDVPLTPQKDKTHDIFRALFRQKAIALSQITSHEHFSINRDGSIRATSEKLSFDITLHPLYEEVRISHDSGNNLKVYAQIKQRINSESFHLSNKKEIQSYATEIIKQELLEYVRAEMVKRGFHYFEERYPSIDDEILEVILNFPLSESYYIAWEAVRSIFDNYMVSGNKYIGPEKDGLGKEMLRIKQQIDTKKWLAQRLGRPSYHKESAIFKIVFYNILKVQKGWEDKPLSHLL